MFTLLFLGDVVGKIGRQVLSKHLANLVAHYQADMVIANGENAAGGLGIDASTAGEIFKAGVNIITSGNHIWQKKEVYPYLESNKARILRPLNFPPGAPGAGWLKHQHKSGLEIAVVNLIGRVFMPQLVDCPFRCIGDLLAKELSSSEIIIVDFHAEATSEKVALGYFLDGKVTLVAGTHTHVQTADNRLLPKQTAFISDLGMCGPQESVIGVKSELVVERFLSGLPGKFDVASGNSMINGVVLKINEADGKAISIERIYERYAH
ncbi:MAG: TIGR00282 family metallophosphoesterase [Deltaproteobacteria bacterium]|nr:TIGR00282 family metallophosphoesterase [Deltaproteobacteria bacterium]